MEQGRLSAESRRELSKINFILNMMESERIQGYEEQNQQDELNFSLCPNRSECICANNADIFRGVCFNNYATCPGYNIILSGKGYLEELNAINERSQMERVA